MTILTTVSGNIWLLLVRYRKQLRELFMSSAKMDGGDSAAFTATSVVKRVQKIRASRSAQGLLRWEIHVSAKLQKSIKELAKNEGLSVGDTAEALMLFGMQHFQELTRPSMGNIFKDKPKPTDTNWLAGYLKNQRQ